MLVATGVALSFTPTTVVIAAAMPETHAGLASGLAGSATQIGAALGTATFTAIGLAASGGDTAYSAPPGSRRRSPPRPWWLATAVLGCTITRAGR